MARRHRELRYLFGDQLAVEKEILSRKYKEAVGILPNLDAPRTFTEKIQWRKLFDRRPIFPVLTDKLRVRPWVEARVGSDYLIPLLHAGKSPAAAPLETLPFPYIVKPNHSTGMAFPVYSKKDLDASAIRCKLAESLRLPSGILDIEWAYWPIEPLVIVERLLLDTDGRIPSDFKFHCFGGKAHFIQVNTDRFTHPGQVFYDRAWERSDLEFGGGIAAGRTVEAPSGLQEMLEVAEALAASFDYVRVDLYDVDGTIYFGEMTLYPASGFRRFTPAIRDLEWGDLWQLPAPARHPESHPADLEKAVDREPDAPPASEPLSAAAGSG